MAKVNIIYHYFPHYRRPVMRELVKSGHHEYRFWGSLDDHKGIRAYKGDDLVQISPISFHVRGNSWILKGFWPAVFDHSADVIILHGHPNMPASWQISIVARLLGKKMLYWAHAWRRKESFLKSGIRNLHYGLAHKTMTYAERARDLAGESGFPRSKVAPIYNSLDWETSRAAAVEAQKLDRAELRRELGLSEDERVLFCSARLISECRFDLLIEAAADLRRRGDDYSVVLVGDGPERDALERMAKELDVPLKLMGAVYDERELAKLYRVADLTVSPGKIGLTAMQSLTNGVPAVTHDDLDAQMPEVEAIVPGRSGAFFRLDHPGDLARAISNWFETQPDKAAIEAACLKVMESKYTPKRQVELIECAIDEVLDGK